STEWLAPFLPFSWNDRILACQKQLEERKVVVSPEELVSHLHRRNTKDPTGNRLIGLLTKAVLDLGCLRLCHQSRTREAHFVRHVLDDRGVAKMQPPNPGCPEQRIDQSTSLGVLKREHGDPQGKERIEWKEGRWIQRDAQEGGLAEHVLTHP